MLENPADWTISSQASEGSEEGSTHRAWSPDRTVKPHECAATKRCVSCHQEKPLTEFEGQRSKCKRCRQDERTARYHSDPIERERRKSSRAKYVAGNAEKAKESDARSYQKRREQILEQKRSYHADKYEADIKPKKAAYRTRPEVMQRQAEYMRTYSKAHYESNKASYLAKFLKRREQKRRAMPSWADIDLIESIYTLARVYTDAFGERFEVDHVVPLQGETVCGLHTHDNLQIMKQIDNRKKSNRLVEDIC